VRAVLDTNVLLSGLLWHGTPHALMEQVREGALGLVSSPALIAELARIVTRTKFGIALARSDTDPERLLAELRLLVEIIQPAKLPAPVSRDADDDEVLALAVTARADFIVSGDGDLLVLGSYGGIPIVTPAQALAMLEA
jgi:putative PIN family toxin of toxin-antitoxin system